MKKKGQKITHAHSGVEGVIIASEDDARFIVKVAGIKEPQLWLAAHVVGGTQSQADTTGDVEFEKPVIEKHAPPKSPGKAVHRRVPGGLE